MIKNKYVAFVLFVIAFLAFWNLADYLYTTFITNGARMGHIILQRVVMGLSLLVSHLSPGIFCL